MSRVKYDATAFTLCQRMDAQLDLLQVGGCGCVWVCVCVCVWVCAGGCVICDGATSHTLLCRVCDVFVGVSYAKNWRSHATVVQPQSKESV